MRSILLRRVGAYGIDITLLFVILTPLGFLVQWMLGLGPSSTPQEVYFTLVLNFSLPVWVYFTLADRSESGATLGKRSLSICTQAEGGEPVGLGQALARTAVKMVPWEVTHASAFLFAPAIGELATENWVGIGAAYVLVFVYLVVAWRTQGRRSVHDLVASTSVERAATSLSHSAYVS
ncbi:MAG: RDD family protein [Bacteroidota bacterium]